MRFLDIDLTDITVSLCGNYGDPIYHPDLATLIKQLKSRGASIILTTNGSHRKEEWWREVVHHFDYTDKIVFSIDGLPQNFTRYRINGDWNTIEQAIKICVEKQITTIWKFIPFQFNQYDIDDAKKLCESLGMSDFSVVLSSRFDDKTLHFLPPNPMISKLKIAQDDFKKGIVRQVEPKCGGGTQHFISADGFYSPCCFVADHRFHYKTIFGQNKKRFDIRTSTLTNMLQNPMTTDFYQNINIAPPQVCHYSCPTIND